MTMRSLALVVIISISTTSCLDLNTWQRNRQPKSPEELYSQTIETYELADSNEENLALNKIELFFGVNATPKKSFEQVSLIRVTGDYTTPFKILMTALKEKAMKQGANAVMEITSSTEIDIYSEEENEGFDTYSKKTLAITGIAIKYTERARNLKDN